jgi:hypothetical protein
MMKERGDEDDARVVEVRDAGCRRLMFRDETFFLHHPKFSRREERAGERSGAQTASRARLPILTCKAEM